jgi:hypothetical protein
MSWRAVNSLLKPFRPNQPGRMWMLHGHYT